MLAQNIPHRASHDVAPAHGSHAVARWILDERREDPVHSFARARSATAPSWKAIGQDGRAKRRARALSDQPGEDGQTPRLSHRRYDVKCRAVKSYDYSLHYS